jgi:uncharacterized membrane protein YbaN (DUF454 family)
MTESILSGTVGIVVVCLGVSWIILSFFIPFFVYGIWCRMKESEKNMDIIIKLLTRIK